MRHDTGISVRRNERYEIVLPVRFRIEKRSERSVRFRPHASPLSGYVEADLIDISRGGVGVILNEFFPKGTRLEMRICALDADPSRPILVGRVRVQRSRMTDSRPGYLIGAAFIDTDPVFERDLDQLIGRITNSPDAQKPDVRKPVAETTPGKGAA